MHGRPSRDSRTIKVLVREYPQEMPASSLGGYFFAFFPPEK